MDWYTNQGQGVSQGSLEAKQIRAMFLSMMAIVAIMIACVGFSQHFSFLDRWFVIGVFGCVWVPQVVVNYRYGWGNVPTFRYAFMVTSNLMYMPIYFKWNSSNFMGLKPLPSSDIFWPIIFLVIVVF